MKSGPRSPQLEKALAQKRRPNTAKNKERKKERKKERIKNNNNLTNIYDKNTNDASFFRWESEKIQRDNVIGLKVTQRVTERTRKSYSGQ